MLYISYVGTVPTLCILNVRTVPLFRLRNIKPQVLSLVVAAYSFLLEKKIPKNWMTIVCLTAHIYKIQYSATFVLQSEFQNAWRSIIYFEIYLSECKSFLQSQIFNIFFVFWILNNENDQKSNFRYQYITFLKFGS